MAASTRWHARSGMPHASVTCRPYAIDADVVWSGVAAAAPAYAGICRPEARQISISLTRSIPIRFTGLTAGLDQPARCTAASAVFDDGHPRFPAGDPYAACNDAFVPGSASPIRLSWLHWIRCDDVRRNNRERQPSCLSYDLPSMTGLGQSSCSELVGWAKARSAVPTRLCTAWALRSVSSGSATSGRTRCAQPTLQIEQLLRIAVGDALLIGGADRDLLEEGAGLRHRAVGVIDREHDALGADFEEQPEEGRREIEAAEV